MWLHNVYNGNLNVTCVCKYCDVVWTGNVTGHNGIFINNQLSTNTNQETSIRILQTRNFLLMLAMNVSISRVSENCHNLPEY